MSRQIPSYGELKQILYRNPTFQPSTILTLDTSNRNPLTPLNNPSWNLPIPVKGAYAVSLKCLTLPVSWPNVLSNKQFQVVYGAVTAFPLDLTLPIGRYSYNLYGGRITYAMASAAPVDQYLDDLVYYILRYFSGAVQSIAIDPSTGVWTWIWDSSCVSVTCNASTYPDVRRFFRVTSQFGLVWQTEGTVDLTGPKHIMIGCGDLATGTYVSSATSSQNFLCSCPVSTLDFGDLLVHEPPIEHTTWFAVTSKFISTLTLGVVDAATNQLLPLDADWAVELKVYVEVQQ